MGWFLGKLLKITLAIVILAIISGIAYVLFVNPDNFKPRITQLARSYTGLPIEINGPITWRLGTKTTLNINDIMLPASAEDQTPALQVKEAIVVIDLVSIMQQNVIIHDLKLNNVVADLMLLRDLHPVTEEHQKTVSIQDFTLKNGTITIKNPTENLNWLLQNVFLSANHLVLNRGAEMPTVNLRGDVINIDNNAKYALDTIVKFDPAQKQLLLDPLKVNWNDTPLHGNANIVQVDTDPVISGNMTLDATDVGALLKKMDPYYANSSSQVTHTLQMQTGYSYALKEHILDLTKLQLQLDKGMMSGDVKLGLIAPYQAEFSLIAENIDFEPLGMLGSALFPSIHTMSTIPVDMLKNITVSGKLSGTKLTINNDIKIDQLHMEINGKGGVVQLMPIVINAYGGTHNAALHIDVASSDQPSIQFTEQADNVDLEPIFKIANTSNNISGTATLKVSLKATGHELSALTHSMSGGIMINVNNGVYQGFDATRLMQFANQTVIDIFAELGTSPTANANVLAVKRSSDWIKTQQDNPKTKFDSLQFSAEIEQGVGNKANLSLVNNAIELKGTGKFTLTDQTVNFDTTLIDRSTTSNTDIKVLSGYMKQTPFTMSITGLINKPVFGPNVQTYVTTILNSTVTDLQTMAATKMVSITPPNQKTDKTATDLFINSLQSLNK